MNVPCLTCGAMTRHGSRCEDCRLFANRLDRQSRPQTKTKSTKERGYSGRWQALSKRARELQPFCRRCGSTNDLQADHSPRAWWRHERGLAVRLKDIDVLCGNCNREMGEARPGSPRYAAWEARRRRATARRMVGR